MRLKYTSENKRWKFKTIASYFLYVVFVVSLAFTLAPIYPEIAYRIREFNKEDIKFDNVNSKEVNVVGTSTATTTVETAFDLEKFLQDYSIPIENRIIIPAIGVDMIIVEGSTDDSLSLGAWRRPKTSTPDVGGNTVITAHRFQYLKPEGETFYNMDKIEYGDAIIVYWGGVPYIYYVTEVFEVTPTDVYVEDNTDYPLLTLYTCTPMWTSERRLVVRALQGAEVGD